MKVIKSDCAYEWLKHTIKDKNAQPTAWAEVIILKIQAALLIPTHAPGDNNNERDKLLDKWARVKQTDPTINVPSKEIMDGVIYDKVDVQVAQRLDINNSSDGDGVITTVV